MNKTSPTILTALAISSAALVGSVGAASISTWTVARDNTAPSVNTGLNTSSPTFGNGTASNADNMFVVGQFGEVVSLAVGQTLNVTFDITLTGGVSTNPNQYRFVVGDYGVTADESWVGGWNFVTDQGLYRGRTNGNIQSTSNNALNLSATTATSGIFDGDSIAAYTFTFSITRDSATTVDLFGSLVGGDGPFSLTYTKENQGTSLFGYTGVGLLFGDPADLDQASISTAQFTVVPEPSSTTFLGLTIGMSLIFFRRRA
ncbi:hypothetical protein [Haloferula sp.]|uniref:hypothetical protein n=1 Tax=Haloferula sp. TaxID=2497595 RepID=UPI003C780D52